MRVRTLAAIFAAMVVVAAAALIWWQASGPHRKAALLVNMPMTPYQPSTHPAASPADAAQHPSDDRPHDAAPGARSSGYRASLPHVKTD
jgi:hypothetical protein